MITIELRDAELQAALARGQGLLGDLTPVMQAIGEALVQSSKDRIAAGQTPEGTAFAPRSQVTEAVYARKGWSYGLPLNVGGDLRGQVHAVAGPDRVEVGSPMAYAAMMQFGGSKARFPHLWGDIPARPYLGLSEDDRTDVLAEVAEAITGALGHARDRNGLIIDENHATDHAAPHGLPAPSRGRIVEMQGRPDGIWGRVE